MKTDVTHYHELKRDLYKKKNRLAFRLLSGERCLERCNNKMLVYMTYIIHVSILCYIYFNNLL